jgi:hypothetical protein
MQSAESDVVQEKYRRLLESLCTSRSRQIPPPHGVSNTACLSAPVETSSLGNLTMALTEVPSRQESYLATNLGDKSRDFPANGRWLLCRIKRLSQHVLLVLPESLHTHLFPEPIRFLVES